MKSSHIWTVQVDQEAIDDAFGEILELYPFRPAQDDMLGWMERFLEQVMEDPLNVLGFPPRQVASDPDMMYFPGNLSAKISGVGHVSKSKKLVRVFKIVVKKPRGGRP